MRTIEDVLDEMIGANYMITQSQIQEIREIHAAEHVPDTNDGGMIAQKVALDAINGVRGDWPLEAQEPIDDCENAVKELLATSEKKAHWEKAIFRSVDHHTGTTYGDGEALICSACRNGFKKAFVDPRWKYCPACGAKMEGDE